MSAGLKLLTPEVSKLIAEHRAIADMELAEGRTISETLTQTLWATHITEVFQKPLGLSDKEKGETVSDIILNADLTYNAIQAMIDTLGKDTAEKLEFIWHQSGDISKTGWSAHENKDVIRDVRFGSPRSLLNISDMDDAIPSISMRTNLVDDATTKLQGWVLRDVRVREPQKREVELSLENPLGYDRQDESLFSLLLTAVDFALLGIPPRYVDVIYNEYELGNKTEIRIPVNLSERLRASTVYGVVEFNEFVFTVYGK